VILQGLTRRLRITTTLCGVALCAVGLTAAPANASPSGAVPSGAVPSSASAASAGAVAAGAGIFGSRATVDDPDDEGPAYLDCHRTTRGQLTALKPAPGGRLTVTGTLKPCRKPHSGHRLVIGAFGSYFPKIAGMAPYGAAPEYGFTSQVTLPVGTTAVCLMRTPFSSDDCFKVTVKRASYGSAVGTPVVGERISTAGKRFRARTDPPPIGFCATCW
jgi:hypothetical protein